MKSNKILLIRPQNIYKQQNYPPLGLILIGSALSNNGYNIKILVNDDRKSFYDEVLNYSKNCLFVGITITTSEIVDAIKIVSLLRKKYYKDVKIVWGGWHSILFSEQMIRSDLVDYVVTKGAEIGIIKLANFLSRKNNYKIEKIISNDEKNLDHLPFPKYDLVDNLEKYITSNLTDKFQEYYEKPLRWLPYESSRGCPYDCAFCINTVTGNKKYRVKDSYRVAQEIAEIVKRFNLTHIKIIDDLFFADLKRVNQIIKEANKIGIKYTWDAECRVEYIKPGFIDDEMLYILKNSGLIQLTFGIESGSLNSLKRMNKGSQGGPGYALNAIQKCSNINIATRGSFVLDVPGDTKKDILESVRLIRKLRKFNRFACGVHTYRPYPRSPLCEKLIEKKVFYQPETFEEWQDEKVIRQFTDTTIVRKWQTNYKLSSRVSFYESLESEFWLKPHQIKNNILKKINNIFIKIAKIRNKHQFYYFTIDKKLYIIFKDFYNRNITKNKKKII